MSEPAPEAEVVEIDPSIHVTETGAYFLVVPAPAFQEQLDRIEAMLAALMPKGETEEPPDFTDIYNYLKIAEPDCVMNMFVDIGDGTYKVKTKHPVSADTQDWIKSQFRETITFEVVE